MVPYQRRAVGGYEVEHTANDIGADPSSHFSTRAIGGVFVLAIVKRPKIGHDFQPDSRSGDHYLVPEAADQTKLVAF